MAVGYLLMGAAMMLIAAFQNLPALVAGMVVFTIGEMIYAPVAGAYLSGLAPARMRGRYMGAWGFANSLSLAIGPGLGMLVFARSPVALWLACAAMAALAAVTIQTGWVRRERPSSTAHMQDEPGIGVRPARAQQRS
jgi:MFS family permease